MTNRDEIDFEDDESIEARLQAVKFVTAQDGLDVSELTLQGGDDDYVGAIIDIAVSELDKRNTEITRLNERVEDLIEALESCEGALASSYDVNDYPATPDCNAQLALDKARAALNTKDG